MTAGSRLSANGGLAARRSLAAVAAVALVVAVGSLPAAAYPRPGRTERVSVAGDGTEGNAGSYSPSSSSITADGRYVAFESEASNLVPGDGNGTLDVFVHDRATGVTERVSVASDGAEGNSASIAPSISADGRYVAFNSWASNLVPGITNGVEDIFVHDRQTGATERVSVASDGTEADGQSNFPTISGDGRYIAFHSWATNLVPDDTNEAVDVFVHDRTTGATERVSVASDGQEGNSDSSAPVSSSVDGRYVAFRSNASNLVPDDTNGVADVFVHDRQTGITERVSVSSDGGEGNQWSTGGSISADGRYVAFYSEASNLIPGDSNHFCGFAGTSPCADVLVRDHATGVTERVSVGSDGREGDHSSLSPAISADGRYVAFRSFASNLVPGDTNGTHDIFVHDRLTAATDRLSVSSEGQEANDWSFIPSISDDGRYVAFHSAASNLVPDDRNNRTDIFVHDRGPAVGVGDFSALLQAGGVAVSGWATLSGTIIASASASDDDQPAAVPTAWDLTEASLIYRPETEDLLVRLRLSWLPGLSTGACIPFLDCPSAGAGAPGVLYGAEFRLEGGRYEVRALRSATAAPPAAPRFALYECETMCTESAVLSGSIGSTGSEVLISLPISVLGAGEGAALADIRAFTAVGEATSGGRVTLDELALPDTTIPTVRVSLGVGPASTPEEEVVLWNEADLVEGRFWGSLDVAVLEAGDYRVWARACLGTVCGTHAVEVTL